MPSYLWSLILYVGMYIFYKLVLQFFLGKSFQIFLIKGEQFWFWREIYTPALKSFFFASFIPT